MTPPTPRWWPDADGVLRPLINRIHVIPLENGTLLHCAQVTCWCSPSLNDATETICTHNAVTSAEAGWVNIGEVDDSIPPPEEGEAVPTVPEILGPQP
jgi:hypothetical protein